MKVTNRFLAMFSLATTVGFATLLQVHAKDLAKVKGRVITDKDLRATLGALNESQKDALLKDPNAKRLALQSAIDLEVLSLEGERMKLDEEAEFKEAVKLFKKQLLMNRVLEKKLSSQLSPNVLKKYYESHLERFSTDQVRVQHILLTDEDTAKKVLKLAKAPHADFMALAEQYSTDPSAKNNRGEVGFISREGMAPEFTEAAFRGAEGDVVGPVQTVFGYHVIRVMQKKFGKPLEFDEVELRVREIVREQETRNFADSLRKQLPIEVDQKAVDKS
jgi:peptidyl-prolyl cis-trans isomerase C